MRPTAARFCANCTGAFQKIPDWRRVTVSEALARFQAQPLDGIFPGLLDQREFRRVDRRGRRQSGVGAAPGSPAVLRWQEGVCHEDARELAYEELLIAEGSDWNWWYGPEHGSDNRPEFDQLYRDHLANVYRALGEEPPANLSQPILQGQTGEFHEPPSNSLNVMLDGEVTSPFEWMGAGRYRPDPRSGAMDADAPPVREIFYGCDATRLFVRVDGAGSGKLGVEFETGPVEVKLARGRIAEMEAPRAGARFRVTVSRDGLPAAVVPAGWWIELPG